MENQLADRPLYYLIENLRKTHNLSAELQAIEVSLLRAGHLSPLFEKIRNAILAEDHLQAVEVQAWQLEELEE